MSLLADLEKEGHFEALSSQIDARFSAETLSKYYHDPVLFVHEIIHAKPTGQQIKILKAVANKKHVAVRSGHGIGKSTAIAWVILWFMCTRSMAKIPATAPSSHQLYDILWSELSKWHRQMNPTFANKFEMTSDRFYNKQFKEEWYCVARTARKEAPEALQGFHGENLLFILEEAAGIPDEIYQVSEGSLTSKDNLVLAVGNPTRINGFFYDCFHRDRDSWHCLHFSSLDSPLVDQKYSKRMANKYGQQSNIYKVRVLGDFPSQEDDQLIPLDLLESATVRDLAASEPIIWAVDPARFGNDETALAKRHGGAVTEIKAVRNYDTMQIAGWIANEFNSAKDKPEAIYVDIIGIGSGVADRLRELKFPVHDVNVAESAKEKSKYLNLRAELWHRFKDWLLEQQGKIPNDSELIGQASAIKYHFDSSGKIAIEKKEDLKKRGLPSPDRADAVCLTFAHNETEWEIIVGNSLAAALAEEDELMDYY
jgi:hypothetical protein